MGAIAKACYFSDVPFELFNLNYETMPRVRKEAEIQRHVHCLVKIYQVAGFAG